MTTTTAPAGFAIGQYSDYKVAEGLIVKVTHDPLPTFQEADLARCQLEEYHAALAAGPLAVAAILGTSVTSHPDGYRVVHVMEYLDGPSLADLPEDKRRPAVSDLAQAVQEMPTHEDGRLITPVDLRDRNIIMCGQQAVATDVSPSWVWGADRLIQSALYPNLSKATRFQTGAMLGYRAAVMSDVLLAALPDKRPGETDEGRLKRALPVMPGAISGETEEEYAARALTTLPDWCADLVPAGISAATKGSLADLIEAKLKGRLVQVWKNQS